MMSKEFRYSHIFFLSLAALMMGVQCADKNELPSAAIKASDSVQLLDDAGMSPVTITFRGTPSSIKGSSAEKTSDVPFDAMVNLNQSPQAYAAIQWGRPDPISMEIMFVDIQRVEHRFAVETIQKGPDLTKLTKTHPIPFPIEDIAMIVLMVDGKEVAWFPAHQKTESKKSSY